MKKTALIIGILGLVGLSYANTNGYVNLDIGLYDARNSLNYDYHNEEMYAVSIGKYFNDKKCVLELELNSVQFQFEDLYISTDTTTTIVDNGDGSDAIIPIKPGNGQGHAYGWHRRNPIVPAVPSTQSTNTTTTTSVFADGAKIRLSSVLVNAEYRLINNTQLTPYASIGCGSTYAQVDFNMAKNYTETGFTYQGGLGIDIASKNRCVAINLGARYFHTMFEGDFDIYGLQYLAGLKFNF